MKRELLFASFLLCFTASFAQFGRTFKSETTSYRDSETGMKITVLTDTTVSRDNKWAVGDTFAGNIWLINVETGQKHQLVSQTKMKPDHSHPSFSHDGKYVIFQSGHFTNGKRLNLMRVDISKITHK